MSTTDAYIALRDHLAVNPREATCIDTDYGTISTLLHTAMCETAKSEEPLPPCYLRHMGYFSYSLVATARTQTERALLTTYAKNLLEHLVEFHLAESQITVPEA
jgi:hypothetical protein